MRLSSVRRPGLWRAAAAALLVAGTASAAPQTAPYQPPQHNNPPPLLTNATPAEINVHANAGSELEFDRPAKWALAEHRKLERALTGVLPQRKGVVDAYVIAIALDSDPVFGREAREAGKVLARRYDAAGRTIVLAGTDGSAESSLPRGSPGNLAAALARIAEAMDPKEDVLILYTTSHGAQFGIVYNDGDQGIGAISPFRLWKLLGDVGIENRMLILSACYSGVFVPLLSAPNSVVISAAASDRSSFGCVSENDWTFFGDALINHALRKAQPLDKAFAEARGLVGQWEAQGAMLASNPQVSIGADVAQWLAPLEKRTPAAPGVPVGRPATEALADAAARRH
jgi:hypothetical protein